MGATRAEFDHELGLIPSMAHLDEAEADRLFERFQEMERSLLLDPTDFFRYRLFEHTMDEASEILTHQQYAQLCGRVNDPVAASGLYDKVAFYQEYEEFLGRDWVVGVPENRPVFKDICARNRRVAYKTRYATYGGDFNIMPTREQIYLWRDAVAERAIIEELVIQHEDLARIFPGSVNSIRVLTAIDPAGQISLVCASLRCGRDEMVTDTGGGLFAGLDLETGALVTDGFSHLLERFERHPNTDVAFRGFVIPEFDGLLSRVHEAAGKHPELRLVNWDWACRNDGVWCLLQANLADGIGPCQEVLGRGLKSDLYRALGLEG